MMGRSIRENVERSYWGHCYDAWLAMMDIRNWPWRGLRKAVSHICNFTAVVIGAFLWPIIVPIAGYTRKKHALRQMELATGYKSRMASRVQKVATSDFEIQK